MFYNKKINRLYLINGLARSGNHLFISWLISGITAKPHEIFYLNNIKPTFYGLLGSKQLNFNKIFKYHSVCSDNKYGKKINKDIREKLAKQSDMSDFLKGKKKINVLIMSMENKKVDKLDLVGDIFNNTRKIYKCIVIRDILNLISSRIKSEEVLHRVQIYYSTDEVTVDYWLNNHKEGKNKKYITFNYNKFVCYAVSRRALAKKLGLKYKNTLITLNNFGLTAGSSFDEETTDKTDYMLRWLKIKNHKLILYVLANKEIIKILEKSFSMKFNKNKTVLRICRKDIKI